VCHFEVLIVDLAGVGVDIPHFLGLSSSAGGVQEWKAALARNDQAIELGNITQENRAVVDFHEKIFKIRFCTRQPCCALPDPYVQWSFREACWLVAWLFRLAQINFIVSQEDEL
jgi:hypothetical protein